MAKKIGWTRKSYDALHEWIDASKRDGIRKILRADGLDLAIERLDAAKTMADWYAITREAADAVGETVVEQSASAAARNLGRMGGGSKSPVKSAASRANGAKGGRPRKAT